MRHYGCKHYRHNHSFWLGVRHNSTICNSPNDLSPPQKPQNAPHHSRLRSLLRKLTNHDTRTLQRSLRNSVRRERTPVHPPNRADTDTTGHTEGIAAIFKDEILENNNRRKIYQVLEKNPGTYLRELQRIMNMPLATVEYHIDYMTRKKLIFAETEDHHKRYYTKPLDPTDKKLLPALRQKRMRNRPHNPGQQESQVSNARRPSETAPLNPITIPKTSDRKKHPHPRKNRVRNPLRSPKRRRSRQSAHSLQNKLPRQTRRQNTNRLHGTTLHERLNPTFVPNPFIICPTTFIRAETKPYN